MFTGTGFLGLSCTRAIKQIVVVVVLFLNNFSVMIPCGRLSWALSASSLLVIYNSTFHTI